MGRNAVGYLTESMHGAGSPQAQRIQIGRQMQLEFKKELAKNLAGIAPGSSEEIAGDLSGYMAQVFATVEQDAN
jgi:4-hydroxybutyryl-CoA dehydratase/vinylacetyl-CoA-Delta-isomerase